tara:strand:- start:1217 stop:1834 length:618 start_codon:yes stop_codon:yes gene_type:complete
MISTQGTQSNNDNQFTPSFIGIGVHFMKINSLETFVATTGSTQIIFNLETEPITDEGFKHFDGNAGQTGKVKTFFLKSDGQQKEFFSNLRTIATKLGVETELDAVNNQNLPSFDAYVAAVSPILNKAGYAWFKVAGDEYEKSNGKVGVSLRFARYGFVASTTEGETHLTPIDSTNKFDLKKLEVIQEGSPIVNGGTELPAGGNMY